MQGNTIKKQIKDAYEFLNSPSVKQSVQSEETNLKNGGHLPIHLKASSERTSFKGLHKFNQTFNEVMKKYPDDARYGHKSGQKRLEILTTVNNFQGHNGKFDTNYTKILVVLEKKAHGWIVATAFPVGGGLSLNHMQIPMPSPY